MNIFELVAEDLLLLREARESETGRISHFDEFDVAMVLFDFCGVANNVPFKI